MNDWDEEFEEELEAARQEAEENGEEFDEDDWIEEHRTPSEEDEWGTEFSDEPEDPWAEEEHEQRARKGSGGSDSNRGLRLAEQNAGDFYEYAHMEPNDGHGISVPQLTAFEKGDSEKTFCWPDNEEKRHTREMEILARKYKRNEELDEGTPRQKNITDYEDDILANAEARVDEFFDGDREEEHFRRLREDIAYTGSADREHYNLHRELMHKLEMYEDRISKYPNDKDLYLPHVHGALKAIDNARHLYAKKRERQEALEEMRDSGELSDMQHQDQSIALEARLQRQLTNNEYKAISGGSSMFEDVGAIMDDYNNMLDDIYSDDPNTLQKTREIVGSVPREVAEKLLQTAYEDGLITQGQKHHLLTMAARTTYSMERSK